MKAGDFRRCIRGNSVGKSSCARIPIHFGVTKNQFNPLMGLMRFRLFRHEEQGTLALTSRIFNFLPRLHYYIARRYTF